MIDVIGMMWVAMHFIVIIGFIVLVTKDLR